MNNFFQIITTKITTFFTVVVISITSILPWSGDKIDKPTITPAEQVSSTIIESSTPSASLTVTPTLKAQSKTENIKINLIPTSVVSPSIAPKTTSNTSPTSNNTQSKTYSIVPISTMNIASMTPVLQVVAQKAYQEFLRTSNINQLDDATQIEILVGIYARMLREEIANTQQNVSQLKQTPTPVPIYVNSEVETKLAELRQTLENIQNKPISMNIIEGQKQRAYQDWINNNSSIYSAILGSRYTNDLNTLLRGYGL